MKAGLLLFLLVTSATLTAADDSEVKLKVAAAQFRPSMKVNENCKRIIEYLSRLAEDGVQVAAFPEYVMTDYNEQSVKAVSASEIADAEEQIRQVCRDRRIAAIFGSTYKINGRIYNTAVVFDSRGELVDRYGKLFLAGEKWATPGNHISYFELEGVPSTVMICHDERHPELARLPAIQGARVIYYISYESDLTEEQKLAPYRAQMMARAVENDMFVVASNAPADRKALRGSSHGQSRIIGPDGNVLKEASIFGDEVLVETLSIKPAKMQRPLQGLMGDWWRTGVEHMMQNRNKSLE